MAKCSVPPRDGGGHTTPWLQNCRFCSLIRQWPGTLLYPLLVTLILCGVGELSVQVRTPPPLAHHLTRSLLFTCRRRGGIGSRTS